jgi:hypothetical protein
VIPFPAFAAGTGLAAAAGLHLHWALGGTWPAADRADLAAKVVDRADLPSRTLMLAVTGALTAATALVWTRPVTDHPLVAAGTWTVAGFLAARGTVGLAYAAVRPDDSPFAVRDRWLYSPVCMALAAATAATALEWPGGAVRRPARAAPIS